MSMSSEWGQSEKMRKGCLSWSPLQYSLATQKQVAPPLQANPYFPGRGSSAYPPGPLCQATCQWLSYLQATFQPPLSALIGHSPFFPTSVPL